jgi:polyisoprenyl-teichoic acid--peptidoglycan teichoic acid transferase
MSRTGLGLICAAMLLVLSGCGGFASGADQTAPPRERRARATPAPEPTRPPIILADLLGRDGRLTVLLLGSDRRERIVGERTDAIIVASVDPKSGKVAMVSLPRDTVNVPTAPGRVYAGRINALFFELQAGKGKRKAALAKLRDALAYAFDTEIDYYALLEFDGLVKLVQTIGGVTVDLDEPFVDPTMHIGKRGLRLKAGSHPLDGKTALAYTRSRHTSSDYDRSRRQHEVLIGAAERVAGRQDILPALMAMVRRKVVTDLPLRAAPALLELAARVDLDRPRSVVLEPVRWARQLPSSYTIAPRVLEVQKLFDRLFNAR